MKTDFDAWVSGKTALRPPLAPLLGGLAARAGGVSLREMTTDPGAWTACLTKAAALFEPDAVVVGADVTLSIEAVGAVLQWQDDAAEPGPLLGTPGTSVPAAGRLAAAVETASRLFTVMRPRLGCVAAMAGPLLLARQAFGEDGAAAGVAALRPFQVALVEALCKTGPHVLLFLEPAGLAAVGPAERRAYNTLINVARHYNVATAVLVDGYPPSVIGELPALGVDFCLLGKDAAGLVPDCQIFARLGGAAKGLGFPAFEADGRVAPQTNEVVAAFANPLLTSAAPLAASVDIRALRAAMDGFRGE